MIAHLAVLAVLGPNADPWSGPPIWRDEFDKGRLDLTKWEPIDQVRTGGQSQWDPKMVDVRQGRLHIKIIKKKDGLPRYISGAVRTRKNYDVNQTLFGKKFGYFECKARLPKNLRMDTWFAFWMMTGDIRDGQNDSRKGTEIDIMESFFAFRGEINHALHWGGYGAGHNGQSFPAKPANISDGEAHTYGLLWTPTKYTFYIDQKPTWTTDAIGLGEKSTAKSQGVSQEAGYLKLSVEAATWAGPTNGWDLEGPDEDEVLVDYVRVWDLRPGQK